VNAFVRFLISAVVFAAIFLLGWYVFGIHPTSTEVLLVALASGISSGVKEGLK
jgi:hypothetical protein